MLEVYHALTPNVHGWLAARRSLLERLRYIRSTREFIIVIMSYITPKGYEHSAYDGRIKVSDSGLECATNIGMNLNNIVDTCTRMSIIMQVE